MLIHVSLALEGADVRKRARDLLRDESDVLLQTVRGRRPVWEKFIGQRADLLLVGRSLIPDPLEDSLLTLNEIPEAPRLVVLAPEEDSEDWARLLAAGCYAVLDLSLDHQLLREALSAIVHRLREEATAALTPPQQMEEPRLSDFVSQSPAMQTFMEVVRRVVGTDTTLLLVGETGVGKERLAQAIHAESPRATGPFLAVNCGAIPESLLESELFGHEEGAFTGATRSRRGWFELAHRGTIFLDEIGEMPFHLQVKLLRVLQTRDVMPVGSERPIRVDVRVMAATNRDLKQGVEERTFRPDLFYRLSVVTLRIPPLRERREDIPTLADKYVQYFQSRFVTTVESISETAKDAFVAYSWPGNVRELVNVIERAMLLCPGDEITPDYLPEGIRREVEKPSGRRLVHGDVLPLPAGWRRRSLKEMRKEVIREFERSYLSAILEETGGRIDDTAKRAGINARNLFDKMRNCGLRKEAFRKRKK